MIFYLNHAKTHATGPSLHQEKDPGKQEKWFGFVLEYMYK